MLRVEVQIAGATSFYVLNRLGMARDFETGRLCRLNVERVSEPMGINLSDAQGRSNEQRR